MVGTQMNNEPVAWMYKDEENAMVAFRRDTLPFDAIPLYTHPIKESKAKDRFSNYESICLRCGTTIYKPSDLTDEEKSKLIRTLKWAEDLLRVSGHDEASSDAQDCLMLLKKASNK
jgi:hypothetical protein